jgi:copper chaperone
MHASSYSEVTNVEIDMEGQKVLVTTTLSSDEVLAKIKKTGRECSELIS